MRERLKRLAPKWLITGYRGARYFGITALFFAARLFPMKKNLVVLCSVWGYGDNAKYVAEELMQRKQKAYKKALIQEKNILKKTLDTDQDKKWRAMQIVFITNHPEQVPNLKEITALRTNTPRAVFSLARAKVWVDNNRKEAYIRKRKGQYYIQLWHGGIALKRIEGDCEALLGRTYIRRAKRDSKDTDLFVSNSTFCTQMYRRAFWAQCEIAEYGSPRNDRFVQQAKQKMDVWEEKVSSGTDEQQDKKLRDADRSKEKVSGGIDWQEEGRSNDTDKNKTKEIQTLQDIEKFKISKAADTNKKEHIRIAVYAPTYRTGHKNYCAFDTEKLKEALCARFGGTWRILVRLHPLVAESNTINNMSDIEDISCMPDLYKILYNADILITDYSNTMFEFAITGKPVFLYAEDLEEYQRERGLYFPFDSLPFPKADTKEKLYQEVLMYDAGQYKEKLREFYNLVGLKEEGRAAELVAERIVQQCEI